MGLRKSYFGTPYDLPAIDFALSERQGAIKLLTELWLKDQKKVAFASDFLAEGENIAQYLRVATMVIFDEMFKSTPDLSEIVTARETANRYKSAYELCLSLSQLQFAQGNFLALRMRYDNHPDLRQEWSQKSVSDETLWAIADFFFEFWQQKTLSIYSPEVQILFVTNFADRV